MQSKTLVRQGTKAWFIYLFNQSLLSTTFPSGSDGKESACNAMWETGVQFLGWEDPLEKRMASHSSILAWRIPWTDKPDGYSLWGLRELVKMTEQLNTSTLGCPGFLR